MHDLLHRSSFLFHVRSYDKGHLFHERAHAALSVCIYMCVYMYTPTCKHGRLCTSALAPGLVARARPERVASEGWTSERRTRAGPARGERRVSEGGASQRRARDERALGERGTIERGASEERARGVAGTGLGFLILAPDD